jgi:hypothetical protein
MVLGWGMALVMALEWVSGLATELVLERTLAFGPLGVEFQD